MGEVDEIQKANVCHTRGLRAHAGQGVCRIFLRGWRKFANRGSVKCESSPTTFSAQEA